MAATALAFAVSLTVVLALVAFLLADHLCSVRRRRQGPRQYVAAGRTRNTSAPEVAMAVGGVATAPPLSSKPLAFPFYGHGVLQAPTTYLLTIPNLEAAAAMAPLTFEPPAIPPWPDSFFHHSSSVSIHSSSMDHLVYISNPIYNSNVAAGLGGDEVGGGSSTPFETPDTSPSHLGWECREEEEEENQVERPERVEDDSPTIKAMRKLPLMRPKVWAAGMDGWRPSAATSGSAVTETNVANSFFSSSGGSPSSSSPPW